MPALDIVRVQDTGLRTFADPVILEYAAGDDRIVRSHDLATMKDHAMARLLAAPIMPGLFLIHQNYPIGAAIDEIVMIAVASEPEEWSGRIEYLPL